MSTGRVIPSLVKDNPWVWIEQTSESAYSNVDPSKVGKWMLFQNKTERDSSGLTDLDRSWFSLMPLVESGVLLNAKCSTAMEQSGESRSNGVIICYTADYTDQHNVQEAAIAIHRIIQIKSPIYYKTDEATYAGLYNRLGNNNVSMYRFFPDLTFYKRQGRSSWKLVKN